MSTDRLDETAWASILEKLRHRTLPPDSIHKAIVQLGKPYDERRIQRATDVVATYLNDGDEWVRHEAMWFLVSWGRLPEFQEQAVSMMLHDTCEDNRGYAANCLGVLKAGSLDPNLLEVLRAVVSNEQEDESVRLKAYAAMLKVAVLQISAGDLFDFEIGRKRLQDVDWKLVQTVPRP